MSWNERIGFTILTRPITPKTVMKDNIKKIIKRQKKYGVHYAVTRSLVEGLKKIGYRSFNYQPTYENEIKNNVHVLAGVDTLKYAINLKKKGVISHITAGPNVVVLSTDYNKIICDEAVELYMQPSQWAANEHIKLAPEINSRCKVWAAGIDFGKYSPVAKKVNHGSVGGYKRFIIYQKGESERFTYHIKSVCDEFNIATELVRYGEYNMEGYMNSLNRCDGLIALSPSESQGLFLAEAWAMDVPTICFNPGFNIIKKSEEDVYFMAEASSCPYLTDATGVSFKEISELRQILNDWEMVTKNMSPRQWVADHMTDEVSAKNFLDLVVPIYGKRGYFYGQSKGYC